MSGAPDEQLSPIPVDHPVRQGVDKVVEPPLEPQLELLPTNLMDWEDFERLLLDLGRHELGLRSLSFFGKRGQAQKGLDVVGANAYGKTEGIQSKRYQEFTVADLDLQGAWFWLRCGQWDGGADEVEGAALIGGGFGQGGHRGVGAVVVNVVAGQGG